MIEATAPWDPPPHATIPEHRLKILSDLGTTSFSGRMRLDVLAGNVTMVPITSPDTTTGHIRPDILAAHEADRLSQARLYAVAPHIITMARALAAKGLPKPVDISRAPSPYGFAFFDQPIAHYPYQATDEPEEGLPPGSRFLPGTTIHVPIVAISWGPWHPHPPGLEEFPDACWLMRSPYGPTILPNTDVPGMWLTFYSASRDRWSTLPPGAPIAEVPGRTITAHDMHQMSLEGAVPVAEWDNQGVLRHGDTCPPVDLETPAGWLVMAYVLWQLMGRQGRRITTTEELPRIRAGRRRDQRAGVEPSPVRVVRLNRERRPSNPAPNGAAPTREYSCQWPVDPYWRDTCLNPRKHRSGECTHEEMIVEGHFKGPPDKPLRLSSTVHLLD